MSELASIAGVSQSTLERSLAFTHRYEPTSHFSTQKTLRLFAAQDRMVIDGADASTAAFDVGYESISQYRRQFGKPPMQDDRARREPAR